MPSRRSAAGRDLDAHVEEGKLTLQRCTSCGKVQYPPREVCGACLGGEFCREALERGGTLLAAGDLHHSLEPGFAGELPWTLCSVQLDRGPVVLAQLAGGPPAAGGRVLVSHRRHPVGGWILKAEPESEERER